MKFQKFSQNILAILFMFAPTMTQAASVKANYNDIRISPEGSADKVVKAFTAKSTLFSNHEHEAFDEFGNSPLSDARIIFLVDDHQGIDSRLLSLRAYLELRKKGDVVLFESIDQSKGILNGGICEFLFKAFMYPVKGADLDSSFNPAIRFKTYNTAIERKALKTKVNFSKIWSNFPCAGWDSESVERVSYSVATDDDLSLDQAFDIFELKSEKKVLKPKLKNLPLAAAKYSLANILRNQKMIAAIKQHLTPKNRVFVLAGFGHVPHLDDFFTGPDALAYKLNLEKLEKFLSSKKYTVLKDKKMTQDYIENLRELEREGQDIYAQNHEVKDPNSEDEL